MGKYVQKDNEIGAKNERERREGNSERDRRGEREATQCCIQFDELFCSAFNCSNFKHQRLKLLGNYKTSNTELLNTINNTKVC